jgi:DNA invertase Pin-like site-specific DNA recombinase
MGKVFAYTRVSTIKQGEKGVSLQEQRDAILRYAQQHGLEVIRWFEEKETASKQGRPAFTQMLQLLRLGNAEGVVIHKIDRSARNLQDWADVGKLVDAGTEVHFANEALDLKTVGGRLAADIQAVVAAHYSRNLREEAKKGFYGRLKQGIYPLQAPPGYLNQGGGKLKIKDAAKAPLVIQAFELYRSGRYSLPQLAKEMYARGLRNHRGGPVSITGLSGILTNPFYTGIIRLKKTGEVFGAKHEALISQAMFKEVQGILHGKAVDRVVKHQLTFSRIVRCGTCRYALIGERQKGHIYYRCHNRPFKNPPACPPTAIREEQLEAVILACFERLRLSKSQIQAARAWIRQQSESDAAQVKQQIAVLELQLEAVRARMGRLTDLLLDGSIDEAVFDEKRKALILQEAETKERIKALQLGSAPVLARLEKFVELAGSPSLLYKKANREKKRELLKNILSNLSVAGKNVEITLKEPFQMVAGRDDDASCALDRGTCRTWAMLLTKIYLYFRTNPAALSESA